MRMFVLGLAILAGLKIWIQHDLYRKGAGEALIAVYRDRAVDACRRAAQGTGYSAGTTAYPVDWTRAATIDLVVGSSQYDVAFWQVDHPMWNARFRNPYVRLKSGDAFATLVCTYDIVMGQAAVSAI